MRRWRYTGNNTTCKIYKKDYRYDPEVPITQENLGWAGFDTWFPKFLCQRIGLGTEVLHRHPYILCVLSLYSPGSQFIRQPGIGPLFPTLQMFWDWGATVPWLFHCEAFCRNHSRQRRLWPRTSFLLNRNKKTSWCIELVKPNAIRIWVRWTHTNPSMLK